MRNSFFVFFLFINAWCYGQITLSGTVLDSTTKTPLRYVSILTTSGTLGTLSDNAGHFFLTIPDSLGKESLVFTCIGYETQKLKVNSLPRSNNFQILLKAKPLILPETDIVSYNKSQLCKEKWGSKRSPPRGDYLMNFGCEVALYIPNLSVDTGIISTLKFYVMSGEGNPETPFRAKLYRLNPQDSTPGELLLDTNLIVEADHGNSWADISVEKLNIPIPRDGFFVSMEWLPNCKCFPDSTEGPKGQFEFYGQVLGGNTTLKSYCTWIKNFDRGWTHTSQELEAKPFNAMIAADVLVKCK